MTSYKPQVLAVCSGKGGAGKTTLTVNLGIALSRLGLRVCLLDADTNLANINILLRETPMYTLQDVIAGSKTLSDILISAHGISLIPSASGITGFSGLDACQQQGLLEALLQLEQRYDVILVDTAAGVQDVILSFIEAAQQSVVVVTPEPTSLTDAFSLLRMLRKRQYQQRINVVVNQAASELGARQVFRRFATAVTRYIGYHVAYLGYVIRDELVASAVCAQVPVRVCRPTAASSRCYDQLAVHMKELLDNQKSEQGLSDNLSQSMKTQSLETLNSEENSPTLSTEGDIDRGIGSRRTDATDSEARRESYQQADRIRKKQILDEHKLSLLEFIDDAEQSRDDITDTLQQLLGAYFKRFRAYPQDPLDQLEQMLSTNTLGQQRIDQLFRLLILFHRDKRVHLDRDTAAEWLNQQLTDYVDEYAHYPFDMGQSLVQSMSFGQLSGEAIDELNSLLGAAGEHRQVLAKPTVSEVSHAAIQTDETQHDLNNPRTVQKGLRDGIRFASKLER